MALASATPARKTIKKGLDVPIAGVPEQTIDAGQAVRQVALLGPDYHGMKPTMNVEVGDRVSVGDLLFVDKKREGVRFTSPATGTVAAVNRGAKRVFESVVIDVDAGSDEAADFSSVGADAGAGLAEKLNEAGLWTAFRTRPFNRTPELGSQPQAIFVQAIDTAPLAADPRVVIADRAPDFEAGLAAVASLVDGPTYLCQAPGEALPGSGAAGVEVAEFEGPHPAGLPGTHIHFLHPASRTRVVWTIEAQDVIAIGALLRTGRVDPERVVSLAGPQVRNPRLLRTRLGASLSQLVDGQLVAGDNRIVSGSVLNGRAGEAGGSFDFLGRFHRQISVLEEGTKREFLGWQKPGLNKFSVKGVYASAVTGRNQRFAMTTDRNGSLRAMVPVGSYEKVMPLDILPTQLLRALITHDTEEAQQLGALELDEDDVGLLTFVCPGKYDYGKILRQNLTQIELEG